MLKRKLFIKSMIIFVLFLTFFPLVGCAKSQESIAKDTDTQNPTIEDSINDRISFGKKYYYLGYDNVIETEYYTINENNTATYTHIMKNGDKTTFHQQINFKWTYNGEGECVLIHNGTQMIIGEQDDAFGIARIMHVGKDVIYWSVSGENTYYLSEEYVDNIPYYAKLIKN